MSDFDRGEWETGAAERNAANWDDYECPDYGAGHDGMTTGTERCPDCEAEA